jgi:hypothetical protein
MMRGQALAVIAKLPLNLVIVNAPRLITIIASYSRRPAYRQGRITAATGLMASCDFCRETDQMLNLRVS